MLGQPFSGRAALLSPFDRLIHDRKRVLRIDAIHQDVTFTKTTADAVDHEIKDLAHWLELDLIPPGRS